MKTGNHVTVRYNTYKKIYSQSGIVLGTLPENLRPVVYASGALVGRSGACSDSVAVLIIEESGRIYIYGGNTDEVRNWDGSVSYVI